MVTIEIRGNLANLPPDLAARVRAAGTATRNGRWTNYALTCDAQDAEAWDAEMRPYGLWTVVTHDPDADQERAEEGPDADADAPVAPLTQERINALVGIGADLDIDIDASITGYRVTARGRIANVRWVEQAPYGAQKVRAGNFWAYEITLPDQAAAEQLALKLEGQELAAAYRDDSLGHETGVWCEVRPIYDDQAIAAAAAAEQERQMGLIPDAWQGFAQLLRSRGQAATNATVRDFLDAQLDIIAQSPALSATERRQVIALRQELAALADAAAAARYGERKAWLQALAARRQRRRGRR
jgi:hypothetical protein